MQPLSRFCWYFQTKIFFLDHESLIFVLKDLYFFHFQIYYMFFSFFTYSSAFVFSLFIYCFKLSFLIFKSILLHNYYFGIYFHVYTIVLFNMSFSIKIHNDLIKLIKKILQLFRLGNNVKNNKNYVRKRIVTILYLILNTNVNMSTN